jgi:hypothetical protein
MIDLSELRAFFPESAIDWRVTAETKGAGPMRGLVAAYIDARAVMDRLDEVVGPGNWQDEYRAGPAGGVICRLGVRTWEFDDGLWTWKEDVAENTDYEPVKGGVSDAFKRAAVKWGVARYLYDVAAVWVDLDEHKRPKERPKMPVKYLPAGATRQSAGSADMPPPLTAADVERELNKPPSDNAKGDFTEFWKWVKSNGIEQDMVYDVAGVKTFVSDEWSGGKLAALKAQLILKKNADGPTTVHPNAGRRSG